MDYTSDLFLNGIKNSLVTGDFLKEKGKVIVDLIDNSNNLFSEFYNDQIPFKDQGLVFPAYFKSVFGKKSKNKSEFILNSSHCELINHELISIIGDVFVEKKLGLNTSNISPLDKFTLLILFQTIRLYGLLHDIGHLPFSHIFEFSIEAAHEIFSESKKGNPTIKKIKDIVREGDKIHEALGKKLTSLILEEVGRSICNDLRLDSRSKILRLFSLKCIELCYVELREDKDSSRFASLSSIVANSIDADRLDFVQRDGYVSGVSKSAGNVERIIKLFYLTRIENSKGSENYAFLPSIQSLHDVEKLLYDRFNIYRYMVNHHSVKRSDYLLQKNIELYLKMELDANYVGTSLILIDGIVDVINIIHNIIKGSGSFYENKYSFTQLTDFWLLSFFSQKYFESLLKETKKEINENYQLSLLSEIYESKRSFKSLWKRIYNYKSFITDLGRSLHAESLETKGINYDSYSNYSKESDRRALFFLKNLNDLIDRKEKFDKENEFFESFGKLAIQLLINNNLDSWCRKIEKYANEEVQEQGMIIFVVKSNITDGLSEFYLVDNKDGKTTYTFDEMSSLPKSLKMEADNSMKFFVYYKDSKGEIEEVERVKTINIIVKNSIVRNIKEIISIFAPPLKITTYV